MSHEAIAAYISAAISLISIAISLFAIRAAGRAENININMFKRQGIIDLHMAWRGVNELNTDNLIGPDINNAANALDLTASLWNHDVMERVILYQSYWSSYKHLYEVMKACQKPVPGYSRKCVDFITPEMDKAYEQMKSFMLNAVSQTKVS